MLTGSLISRLITAIRTKASALTPTGVLSRLITGARTLSSGLSLSGAISYIANVKVSGAIAIVGAATYLLNKLRTGAVSFSAIAAKVVESLRTKAGALDFTGNISRIRVWVESRTGGLSFSATAIGIKAVTDKFVSGSIDFFGNIYKGWLWGTIGRALSLSRTLSSALTTAGQVIYSLVQEITGTVSSAIDFAGSVSNDVYTQLVENGTLAISGTISCLKSIFKTYSGTLSASGQSRRTRGIFGRLRSGALTFSSSINKLIGKTYSGAVSFSGDLSRSAVGIDKSAQGALSTAGDYLRSIVAARTKSAALTFSGLIDVVVLAGQSFYQNSKDGILDITGAITALKQGQPDTVTGTLNIYGRITIIDAIIDRISAASISPAGTLTRALITARKTISGAITTAGSIANFYTLKRGYQGALTITGAVLGSIANFRFYTASGSADFTGSSTKLVEFLRTYTGGLDSQSTITRLLELARLQTGGVDLSGTATGLYVGGDFRLGSLALSGDASRTLHNTRVAYESGLSMSGGISRHIVATRSAAGAIDFSGKISTRSREILYLGPPNP